MLGIFSLLWTYADKQQYNYHFLSVSCGRYYAELRGENLARTHMDVLNVNRSSCTNTLILMID